MSEKEYQLVRDRQAELSGLFSRMDKDEDLYLLKEYKMKTLDGTKNMEDVANITLNDSLLFATKALAILGSTVMQAVVEGKDLTDKETTTIERFLEDVYYMIDERLIKRGIISLESFVNEQICIRGRAVARCCLRMENGNLVPDVLPIDARYFVYDTDENGLVWGASIFSRRWSQVEREYGISGGKGYAEVIDYWDKDKECVFIDGKLARTQPNIYGYPPFVMAICPIGSMLYSARASEHQGESIFWPNRHLWEEKNRTASILQTLTHMSLFAPVQLESSHGMELPQPEISPYKSKIVHPVEIGGGYRPMPIGDIKAATRLLYAVIDAALQRGSLPVIDYGTLSFPLSAIAITKLTSSRNDTFLPRLQNKSLFYQPLSYMIIDQATKYGEKIVVGKPGSKNIYYPSDLDGDYTITYRFYTETKEQEIADLQIASAAQNFLSSDTIRRDILKLQDPDGEKMKFLAEQAERADEVLFLYRRACELIDNGQELEAYILAQRIRTILKQRRLQQAVLENPPEASQGNVDLLPLLEQRGGGAMGRRKSAIPTEREEVERPEEEPNA